MKRSEEPIVVSETYSAPAKTVWTAITKADQMRKWYFDKIASFSPVVGAETEFTVGDEKRKFPHRWKVTRVVPLQSIGYDWRYDGFPGAAHVSFDLFSKGDATTLTVTYVTTEDFSSEIAEFERKSGLEGWTYFIQKSLKDYLERAKK